MFTTFLFVLIGTELNLSGTYWFFVFIHGFLSVIKFVYWLVEKKIKGENKWKSMNSAKSNLSNRFETLLPILQGRGYLCRYIQKSRF